MQIPETLKKPPVIIGGIVLIVIIILASRKSQSATSSVQDTSATDAASTLAANVQIAQINAGMEVRQLELGSQERVTLAKLATDENVALTTSSYTYDIANKQLENQRVLGLTEEDTKRLLSTQDNQTRLTLGITALDTSRYLGERAINSQEATQAREIQFQTAQLDSQERIADFSSSRALTYAQIQGQAQVDAVQAAKPSWFQTFMGGLGGLTNSIAKAFVPVPQIPAIHQAP